MLKRFLKFGIPAVLLILFVVLTAVLCSSTVFQGTYKGENPLLNECKYEVKFSGNTVIYTLSKEGEWKDSYFGYYQKIDGNIELNLTEPNKGKVEFKRKNVFTLTKTVDNLNSWIGNYGGATAEMELKNHGAIWLQVFYSVGTVASAAFLIVQIIRQHKAKNNIKD